MSKAQKLLDNLNESSDELDDIKEKLENLSTSTWNSLLTEIQDAMSNISSEIIPTKDLDKALSKKFRRT